jgi:hypothetical protein
MNTFLIASIALVASGEKIDLKRTFTATDKATFDFQCKLQIDARQLPLETFIPQNAWFVYGFTAQVEKMKPDGVADLRFKRPKIVLKEEETFDHPAKDTVLVKDENYLFTMSHKNQLLAVKDETPKKPPPKDGGGLFATLRAGTATQIDIGGWIGQLHTLAGFVNFFDLGPNLPLQPVAIGDTWKETVGYAPVTISAGADKGKSINARIDYVYTYLGKATVNKKSYVHIQGKISQDTDAAPFIASIIGVKLELAPFKEIKLKMDGTVNYYLEPVNLQVALIQASSTGEVAVTIPQVTSGPVYEERFKSRASLTRR